MNINFIIYKLSNRVFHKTNIVPNFVSYIVVKLKKDESNGLP